MILKIDLLNDCYRSSVIIYKMSEDLIQFYIDNSNNDPIIFYRLSSIVTSDIVNKNFDRPWKYERFFQNPNITWDIFKKINLNKYLDNFLTALCQHPSVTWDIVKANPDIKWCYNSLTRNPNITMDII